MLPVDDLHIKPDGDPVPVLRDRTSAPQRILECRGADVDPGATGCQRNLQRFVVPDPAGEFDFHVKCAHHVGEQFAVAAPSESGVQVDQVDPLGPVPLPGHSGLQCSAVLGFATGLSLNQPNRPALDHIDGRQQDQ